MARREKPPVAPYVSEMVQIGDTNCCLHKWETTRPPKALVIFLHGANTHGSFPTTCLVANLLVDSGYAFMAPDFPGHGRSSGLRGHVESAEHLIDFGIGLVEYAYLQKLAEERIAGNVSGPRGMKLFLIGSSMGGNLALQVALRKKDLVSGVILLAPMLRIYSINKFTRLFIKTTGEIFPQTEAFPVGRNVSYRCPKIREECERDKLKPYQEGELVRLGTIKSLVEMVDSLEARFEEVSFPCLLMLADEDKTVNNRGAVDLAKKASSEDVTLKRYPALHGLMGEPSPLIEKIQDDMVNWLDARCDREYYIRSSL